MVGTAAGLFGTPQQGIAGYHFRYRHASPHALAQLAKRAVRDACHGCDDKVIFENMRTDLHDGLLPESCTRAQLQEARSKEAAQSLTGNKEGETDPDA
jgi:hypothetical protein